jgi:hypothetical protein
VRVVAVCTHALMVHVMLVGAFAESVTLALTNPIALAGVTLKLPGSLAVLPGSANATGLAANIMTNSIAVAIRTDSLLLNATSLFLLPQEGRESSAPPQLANGAKYEGLQELALPLK